MRCGKLSLPGLLALSALLAVWGFQEPFSESAPGFAQDGFTTVVFQGNPSPVAGATFAGFASPDVNDAVQVAFHGFLTYDGDPPTNAPFEGLFLASGSNVSSLVLQNSPTPIGGKFQGFLNPRINETGEVAFHAIVAYEGDPAPPPDSGIFLRSDAGICPPSGICTVVLDGSAAPGGGMLSGITLLDLNDRRDMAIGVTAREVLFMASVDGSHALFVARIADGGAVEIDEVVVEGQTLPGPDPDVPDDCPTFLSFGGLVGQPAEFNNSDTIVLQADTGGSPLSDAILRVVLHRDIDTAEVIGLACDHMVGEGDEAPIGGTFSQLIVPSINEAGAVTFQAKVFTGLPEPEQPQVVDGIFAAFGDPGFIFNGKVVHSGDGDPSVRFEPFEGDTNPATVNSEGRPFVISFPVGPEGLNNQGLYLFRGNSLTEDDPPEVVGAGLFLSTGEEGSVRLALEGQASPEGGSFNAFSQSSINSTGSVAFLASVLIGEDTFLGIFLSGDHRDSDGDGLLDTWETDGIDWDGDGNIDLLLYDVNGNGVIEPSEQADPNHKDIYVEIDWMDCAQGGCAAGDLHNHRPAQAALDDVINAFANAPVANPDGNPGIRLHIQVNEPLREIEPILFGTRGPGVSDDFQDLKEGNPRNPCGVGASDGHFGTALERGNPNCPKLLAAKRLAFHYAIFGHNWTPQIGSGGVGEYPGNDFMVTMGNWNANAVFIAGGEPMVGGAPDHATARRITEAALFMHEFGHNLGLGHGGRDSVNYKPNYLSVMNYTFMDRRWVRDRPLDYSRWALPPLDPARLNEAALDETAGIDGNNPPADLAARWPSTAFTRYDAATDRCVFDGTFTPTAGDIDWNFSGGINAGTVQAGINDPDPDPNPLGLEACQVLQDDELHGHDDWQNLIYNFRGFVQFADGSRPIPDGEELPLEDLLAWFDSDGDGIYDIDDNCPAWPNPDQSLPPWTVPPHDPDCDGFSDFAEFFVGTEPLDQCGPSAWPPDFDDSGTVNILDLVQLTPPVFGSTTGSPDYTVRKDFNGDGVINILDLVRMTYPIFGASCS